MKHSIFGFVQTGKGSRYVEHFANLNKIYVNDRQTISPLGEIQEAAFVEDSAGTTSRVLGNYVIVYILDGGGMYRDTRTVQSVCKGDLLLLLPDWRHAYGPRPTQTWNEYYTVFRGPVFDLWRSVGILNQTKAITHLEPVDKWLETFTSIVKPDTGGNTPSQTEMICKLLTALNEALHVDHSLLTPRETAEWIEPAKKRLNEFLDEKYDLTRVAADFGLTYDNFRKRFEHEVGVSPAAYRMQRRIETAQVLLEHSDLAHKEIAASLAFADEILVLQTL